ncbi:MAG: class I tRNA ligase family protein, partial [Clostridia bacterium]|nr:class I tRNA ligase family protein [Clostridia bacterium]
KDGRKMSKHLGNVVDPWSVLNAQGADAIRWYFYSGAPWLPSRFSGEIVSEVQRKFMGTLWNTYAFFIMYADLDSFDPKKHDLKSVDLTLMDRWILSRLNTLIKTVDDNLAQYAVPDAAHALSDFVDELSNWYVRRGRERFWGKGMEGSKEAAFATLYHVLVTLTKLLAPFTPFLSETMYQNLVRTQYEDAPESVHFCDFPIADEAMIDPDVEAQMDALLKVRQLGSSCRNMANIKVRQPVAKLYVVGAAFGEEYARLIEDELNVKDVEISEKANAFVSYRLKPQMRTLGPRYGKLLGKIGARLKELDGAEVVAAFERGETVRFELDGTAVELAQSDVLVETEQKPGLVAQSEGGVTVVLDTNLTDELIREGSARELISKVQSLRKDSGLDVVDRIVLSVVAGDRVRQAVEAFADMVKKAVLAVELRFEPDAAAQSKEVDLNGEKAVIGVRKA